MIRPDYHIHESDKDALLEKCEALWEEFEQNRTIENAAKALMADFELYGIYSQCDETEADALCIVVDAALPKKNKKELDKQG